MGEVPLLKSHLFYLPAIPFVIGYDADLAGNRGMRPLVLVNGEAGHDIGVDAIEKIRNTVNGEIACYLSNSRIIEFHTSVVLLISQE